MHSSSSSSSSLPHRSDKEDRPALPRFRRPAIEHVSAIQSLYKTYPFLSHRMEIHMPYGRIRSTFQSGKVWVWPKFDKRPVGYLLFLADFPPCIWFPERQEGMTFRWMVPPGFCSMGPTVCLANLLASESVLQIEDILIHHGRDVWSHLPYSERWEHLREMWEELPPDQPLLAFTPRIVQPLSLAEWEDQYDAAVYWIIQPDHSRQPRWYWRDVVSAPKYNPPAYLPPKLERDAEFLTVLVAYCSPYTKLSLPDTYSLTAQDHTSIGIASIPNLRISHQLRDRFTGRTDAIRVEVTWNTAFRKYQIVRIMPDETPLTPSSFFHHPRSTSTPATI